MKIKLNKLTLQFRLTREIIDLSHQFTFFHGKIGSGKSSIVRLINFLLGGDLEKTTAIQQEFVSAALVVGIRDYEVLLEREIESTKVRVTWRDEKNSSVTVLAPIVNEGIQSPIWNSDIYNLSDLLFYLLNITPLKVRRSKMKDDSPLIRLSFRDFLVYSYLDQDHLDSSFFKLYDPIISNKSKDVMRFIVGYYSEKLSALEKRLEDAKEARLAKKNSAKELKLFFEKVGYGTEDQLIQDIEFATKKLTEAVNEQKEMQKGYTSETHSTDKLRDSIRNIIKQLNSAEQAVFDLEYRVNEQQSLKSELLSAKFKLAKSTSISNIFQNISFEQCPSCGNSLNGRIQSPDHCHLCTSELKTKNENEIVGQEEAFRIDLDARIEELESSIRQHKQALNRQKNLTLRLKAAKYDLDLRLKSEMETYESKHLSTYRDIERRIATYKERLINYDKVRAMPREIARLERESDELFLKEQDIKRDIQTEKNKLSKASSYIHEIEEIFLTVMNSVGLPGVSLEDEIRINAKTWDVFVWPKGNENHKWNFANAGSGGKKTLFKVCYAIALHIVSSKYNLPLPKFLIIDTPMKNIGEGVNKDIFEKFYHLIYSLGGAELEDHQFIIVDKEYIEPNVEVDMYERYMTPDESEFPPLIPYYRGS